MSFNIRFRPERLEFRNPLCPGKTGYESNKGDKQREIEAGPPPWVLAWADDISETDVALGVASLFGSPAAFAAWVENLVNRTISTLVSDAEKKFPDEIKSQVIQLATDVITKAIEGKSAADVLKNFDTVDFKAGAIQYSGENLLCGQVITKTWGIKPYIGFRWR